MAERIHDTAARGFDSAAEVYERARPGYPAAVADHVIEGLGLKPGDTVADVAAGTGKFTADLLDRGMDVIAVEPVAGMREMFAKVLPGARVLDGTAEALPLNDANVDAITVAQAFHWFHPAEALAEFHRVLRAGGGLALIWNVRDDRVPWVERLTQIIDPHADGSTVGIPRYRDRSWQPAFDATDLFEQVSARAFEHGHATTPASLLERVESTSFIATLDPAAKEQVRAEVRALVEEFSLGDSFDFPYICEVTLFRAR